MSLLRNLDDRLLFTINAFARQTGWLHASVLAYAKYGVVLFGLLLRPTRSRSPNSAASPLQGIQRRRPDFESLAPGPRTHTLRARVGIRDLVANTHWAWGTPMSWKGEPELVTSGPYRLVRHPIYSGILVAVLGTAVALSWLWLIAAVGAGVYFAYAATVEQRYLSREFAATYPAYQHSTKMLIPYIF